MIRENKLHCSRRRDKTLELEKGCKRPSALWKRGARSRGGSSSSSSGHDGVCYITVICMLPRARLLSRPAAISQSALGDSSGSTNECTHTACELCYECRPACMTDSALSTQLLGLF